MCASALVELTNDLAGLQLLSYLNPGEYPAAGGNAGNDNRKS